MSLSDNYPDIRPLWMNDYANAGVIDPRCSFARSDSTPSNVHYWSNEDHLSSENLLLQSSDFDTTWVNARLAPPTANQTDPSGGTDGYTLTEDSSSGAHRLTQSVTATGQLAFTVYAKQNSGTRYLTLAFFNANNDTVLAVYDLAGGSPVTATGSSSTYSSVSTSQTASGNGYYKCVLKATGTVTLAGVNLNDASTTAGLDTTLARKVYTGDGTSSINVAFASLSSVGGTDYQATTTQIHREYAATLKPVSYSGQPRFEYEPTGDREAKGLLIESSSSNLLAGSATIGGAYWNVVNATTQQNSAVAPDGTLTATTLVENSAGGAKYAYSNTYTPAASTTYTFSVFVKPNGRNFCMIYTNFGGAGQSSMFDLVTGATSNLSGSGTNQATQCGNGWWRLSVTLTTTSTTAANFQILPAIDATTIDYTGNGYSGLLCWGAQNEASSFASSYIATSGSASTRTRDQLSVATADIGFEGGPLTLVADSTTETDTLNPVTFHVYKNGDHQISLNAKSDNNRAAYIEADNSYSILTSPAVGNGVRALRVDTNDIATALNGTIDATDTSQTLPDLTGATMYIGDDSNGGNSIDGHIKRVAIFSEALTDTELQSLTS